MRRSGLSGGIERILLATDFSDHAQAALPHAIRFAEAHEARLHLLSVVVPHGSLAEGDEEQETGAHALLEGLDLDGSGVETTLVVRRAIAPGPAILEYADEADIDLITMGSHGRRGLRRWLLGSVTEEVVRASHRPVLTTHGDTRADESPRYPRVLTPVDFSVHTERQIEVAAALAGRLGSEIALVHVVDPPVVPDLYMPLAPLAADMKSSIERISERLEELAAPLRAAASVSTDVLVGNAATEIVSLAGTADLVVMPTHGHQGMDRLLVGSVTEGVLRRTEGTVLILPPGERGLRTERD